MYTSVSGEKKYTPAMIFAKDIMTLVDPKANDGTLVKCKDCGRYFTKSAMKGKVCGLCNSASNFSGNPNEKELYKKYKGLLPLKTRFFSLLSTKYCVEDDELLIIVVGGKKYLVNKLNVMEHGYIDKPKRIF